MNNIFSNLDPASQNNSKKIVREKVHRMKKYPSEQLAHRVELITGESADWSDKDSDFFEPRGKQE